MRIATTIIAAVFTTGIALAQTPAIKVTLSGLGCTTPAGVDTFLVQIWSSGEDRSTSFGGSVSRSYPIDLVVTRASDACSARLQALGAATQKLNFRTLILSQSSAGGAVVMKVQLDNVNVDLNTKYSNGTESTAFRFGRMAVYTYLPTAERAGYDWLRNLPF